MGLCQATDKMKEELNKPLSPQQLKFYLRKSVVTTSPSYGEKEFSYGDRVIRCPEPLYNKLMDLIDETEDKDNSLIQLYSHEEDGEFEIDDVHEFSFDMSDVAHTPTLPPIIDLPEDHVTDFFVPETPTRRFSTPRSAYGHLLPPDSPHWFTNSPASPRNSAFDNPPEFGCTPEGFYSPKKSTTPRGGVFDTPPSGFALLSPRKSFVTSLWPSGSLSSSRNHYLLSDEEISVEDRPGSPFEIDGPRSTREDLQLARALDLHLSPKGRRLSRRGGVNFKGDSSIPSSLRSCRDMPLPDDLPPIPVKRQPESRHYSPTPKSVFHQIQTQPSRSRNRANAVFHNVRRTPTRSLCANRFQALKGSPASSRSRLLDLKGQEDYFSPSSLTSVSSEMLSSTFSSIRSPEAACGLLKMLETHDFGGCELPR